MALAEDLERIVREVRAEIAKRTFVKRRHIPLRVLEEALKRPPEAREDLRDIFLLKAQRALLWKILEARRRSLKRRGESVERLRGVLFSPAS